MKISNDVIQQLREVLGEYITEMGEKSGRFEFSRELGTIENLLYSEIKRRNNQIGMDICGKISDDIPDDVEGDLIIVDEDPSMLPFLEVV